MIILLDLHVHSNSSFDSILSPKIIAKLIKRQGLHGYALTDHDTVDNLEEAGFYAKKSGLIFIPGIERKTDKGDILGLFINENIISYDFEEVISEIRGKGGIVVLPHPFKSHEKVTEEDWKKFDAIEVLNGRCTDEMNTRSIAEANGMPHVGGSDAHTWWELGSVYTQFSFDDNQRISAESIKKSIIEKRAFPYRKRKFNYQQYLWRVRYSRTIKAAKEGTLFDYSINVMKRVFYKK